jgi:hypothetical protein
MTRLTGTGSTGIVLRWIRESRRISPIDMRA